MSLQILLPEWMSVSFQLKALRFGNLAGTLKRAFIKLLGFRRHTTQDAFYRSYQRITLMGFKIAVQVAYEFDSSLLAFAACSYREACSNRVLFISPTRSLRRIQQRHVDILVLQVINEENFVGIAVADETLRGAQYLVRDTFSSNRLPLK